MENHDNTHQLGLSFNLGRDERVRLLSNTLTNIPAGSELHAYGMAELRLLKDDPKNEVMRDLASSINLDLDVEDIAYIETLAVSF